MKPFQFSEDMLESNEKENQGQYDQINLDSINLETLPPEQKINSDSPDSFNVKNQIKMGNSQTEDKLGYQTEDLSLNPMK